VDRSVTISLGGQEYEIFRARLGKYLLIQEAAANLQKAGEAAAEGGGGKAIILALLAYLDVYIPDLTQAQLSTYSWIEIFSAMAEISLLNNIEIDFAILKYQTDSGLPAPWEYPERMRHSWIHILAYAYKWSKEQIENIWPEEAFAYLQEIIAHEQQDREFVHSLSEIAYQYDSGSKKSRYKPLQRPAWMVVRDPKSMIVKLPLALVPVGEIVYPKGHDQMMADHEASKGQVLH
jgi:hypothetical protein